MRAWICLLCAFNAYSETIRYGTVEKTAIEQRLVSVPLSNAERQRVLSGLFSQAGCSGERLTEQPVKRTKIPNVICTIHGETDSTIVVGAHFDFIDAGKEVIDNWSGASLLPSLVQSLIITPRHHTFVFVGFTDEEKGLVGSRYYVNRLSKAERNKIRAMVNLDCLAAGPTKVELDRGNRRLANALASVANSFKLPLSVVNVHSVGRSDSDSFQDKGVPSLNIHSLTNDTWPLLHSKGDQIEAVQMDDYYDTYRLLTAYLAYLDAILAQPEAPGSTSDSAAR